MAVKPLSTNKWDPLTKDASSLARNNAARATSSGSHMPSEAGDFFKSSRDSQRNVLRLNGRTEVTTNGGGLAMGRAGGSNLYTEAVHQLRGTAGERQSAPQQRW